MACCEWACQHVERVSVPSQDVSDLSLISPADPVDGLSQGMTAPAPGTIRAWCHQQDIVAVIGRFVALSRF